MVGAGPTQTEMVPFDDAHPLGQPANAQIPLGRMAEREEIAGAVVYLRPDAARYHLLVVAENYPQLKADQGFRDLQAQLEGNENRITVARNRYIDSVRDFNVTVRSFPTNLTAMAFGFATKPSFAVEDEKALAK